MVKKNDYSCLEKVAVRDPSLAEQTRRPGGVIFDWLAATRYLANEGKSKLIVSILIM